MLSGYKTFIVAAMMIINSLIGGYSNIDGVISYDMANIDWGLFMQGTGLATIREALRKGL